MPNAVLINAFEVPEERDEEFLAHWEAARRFMERQPGYVSTALHRSLDPKARFRYVNVAEWESPQDFRAAASSPEFAAIRERSPVASYPSIYTVLRR